MKKYEKPIMDISIFKTEKIRTTGNGTIMLNGHMEILQRYPQIWVML